MFEHYCAFPCHQRGETDCWSMPCPPLSCPSPVQVEGECCPRCIDQDPCDVPTPPSSALGDTIPPPACFFEGRRHASGQRWVLPWDRCTTCICQVSWRGITGWGFWSFFHPSKGSRVWVEHVALESRPLPWKLVTRTMQLRLTLVSRCIKWDK